MADETHLAERWRSEGKEEKGLKKKGLTIERGGSRQGEQDRAAFSSPWRPQTTSRKKGRNKKQYNAKRVFRILSGHKLSQLGDSYFTVRKQAKLKQHMASR